MFEFIFLYPKMNSPSHPITICLLAAFHVLRTKTALVASEVVVACTVGIVPYGAVVFSVQGYLSQGQPSGQLN